uniref:Iron-binding zinc finger CDGSH type domain-containing protein n=1 Tax=Alexandrium monilatum TaxID=311494 RepID=A0A7S4UVG7_9DINO
MDWPPAEMDFNTKKYEKYHHVIQYATSAETKNVKLCRCWQSKRFPYCDDTHKVLIEAGDNVGPFVAKIQGRAPAAENVAANALQARSQLPRTAAFFMMGFGVVGLACAAASAYARGQRLRVEVNLSGGRAPGVRQETEAA